MENPTDSRPQAPKRPGFRTLRDLFDVGPLAAIAVLAVAAVVIVASILFFIRSAPPTSITISSGPEGSSFYKNAQKYAAILARNGVKAKVLTSNGSFENLQRLNNPAAHVDVGIAQVGLTGIPTDDFVSLGSVSYQPLLVFYRGAPLELLSGLKGKRVAIGAKGSGTRTFALELLGANGIEENGPTRLLDWDADDAAQALLDHKIDAAFIMSESASLDILRKLIRSNDAHLFSFKQAAAYSRKFDALHVLELPEGIVDFGADIPPRNVELLAPMVELVANKGLHPAISDLLLDAATEVHGRAGFFQHRGEFPAPIEHSIHLSEDAVRFHKSGKSFFYRWLPFWLASLTSRIVFALLPLIVVLYPVMKSIPAILRWRTQSKIYRRYHELLMVEKAFRHAHEPAAREALRARFDRIEDMVRKMKVPASFADQFYGLRGHLDYVRTHVLGGQEG